MRNGIAVGLLVCLFSMAGCARGLPAADTVAQDDHPVIVQVVDKNRTVTIKSGPEGLLYSVQDARGRLLLADATASQFQAQHPDLYRQIRDAYSEILAR